MKDRDDSGPGHPGRGGAVTPSGRRTVTAVFTGIGVGVLVVTAFTIMQTRRLQADAAEIVQNMLTSVRLLGRLRAEVQERRILLDDHILSTSAAEMASQEARLRRLDAEVAATETAYQPWATQPNERSVWNRTRLDLASLDAPVGRALALSRLNRDAEAREVLAGASDRFEQVARDFDELVAINDKSAGESLARISRIRFDLVLTFLAIGAAILAAVVPLGRWASRQVARREEEMALRARLLEDRNRELDAFAARVAHDLRNPLTTVNLAIDQLAARAAAGAPAHPRRPPRAPAPRRATAPSRVSAAAPPGCRRWSRICWRCPASGRRCPGAAIRPPSRPRSSRSSGPRWRPRAARCGCR
jgi:signal transduction histidine kinase